MNRPTRLHPIGAIRGLLVWLVIATVASATERFAFATIGCVPYARAPGSAESFDQLIDVINRHAPAFTVHLGDIKGSEEPCTGVLPLVRADRHRYRLDVGMRIAGGEELLANVTRRKTSGDYPVPGTPVPVLPQPWKAR